MMAVRQVRLGGIKRPDARFDELKNRLREEWRNEQP
jgi:hypothetical protein